MSSRLRPEDRERLAAGFFRVIPANYADVGIEESLLTFSGVDSLARLKALSSDLQGQLQDNLPAYVEKVAGVLKGFTPVPNAVGLGAFILATFLQMEFYAVQLAWGKGDSSPESMLESIFAEDKASEVRNLMDEYLKRYKMHLRNDHQLLLETERLESQLSLQLTRLLNSMDKQMSSRAVKHWVNGAAFHAQMLIHVARLRKRTGTGTQGFENGKMAASSAVDTYQNNVMQILAKYKKFKTSTLHRSERFPWMFGRARPRGTPSIACDFIEREIGFRCHLNSDHVKIKPAAYVDYIFLHHKQLKEIKFYFINLQEKIDVLVNQIGDFQIKT